MKLPSNTTIEADGENALVTFFVDESVPYLEGHFEKKAVLPGVVQVGWAITCTEQHFHTQFSFHSLKSVKFTQLVLPPVEVKMSLKYDAKKGLIKFQSHTPAGKCASGLIEVTEQI